MVPLPATQAVTADQIIAVHEASVTALHELSAIETGILSAVAANHRHNWLLWAQEDLARRRNVPDSEIADNKRSIDMHNQNRNDAIEQIDEILLRELSTVKLREGARQSSETAGAMIDRLSILWLKIHHMRLQPERSDVDRLHIETCRAKLAQLVEQRSDLAACLHRLLSECRQGESYFKLYRQFKMYNDPKLNPALYDHSNR